MRTKHLVMSLALLLAIVCISFAEDISISASVDEKTVRLGDVITFTIHIQGTQSISAPRLTDIDGFRVQYRGPSTQISVVNGQSSVSIEHTYSLLALKTGKFNIPSLVIKHGSKNYMTDSIEVEVVPRSSAQEGSEASASEELKKYIQLTISTPRKTAYLNEGIPLLIQLFIRSGVEVRNIYPPTFPSAGFSVLPFQEPTQQSRIIQGVRFRAISFHTTVYPVTCGELALGPAELNCDLMVTSPSSRSSSRDPFFDSFFNQRARYSITVKSDPYTITVNPLPTEGRPDSFSGAVGQYSLSVSAKPTSLKVGEPITLTMTVKGKGNIDAVDMPRLGALSQFKTYDPQINVQKQGNSGEKTFEQVLIPRSDSIGSIPEIRFSYFDPELGRYLTKSQNPIPIVVAPSDEAEPIQILEIAGGKAVKREVLGRDLAYIKDEPGAANRGDGNLYTNKGFLVLQLLPLFGLVGIVVYQRRRERFATDRTYARQYHAPRKARKGLAKAKTLVQSGQPQEFCSIIFKTMQEYLGDRFDLPVAGITIEIVDSLRSRGVSGDVLEKLTSFFQACDRMRFAQAEMSQTEMSVTLDLATESVELLENRK